MRKRRHGSENGREAHCALSAPSETERVGHRLLKREKPSSHGPHAVTCHGASPPRGSVTLSRSPKPPQKKHRPSPNQRNQNPTRNIISILLVSLIFAAIGLGIGGPPVAIPTFLGTLAITLALNRIPRRPKRASQTPKKPLRRPKKIKK